MWDSVYYVLRTQIDYVLRPIAKKSLTPGGVGEMGGAGAWTIDLIGVSPLELSFSSSSVPDLTPKSAPWNIQCDYKKSRRTWKYKVVQYDTNAYSATYLFNVM